MDTNAGNRLKQMALLRQNVNSLSDTYKLFMTFAFLNIKLLFMI